MGLRRYLNRYIIYPAQDVLDLWTGRRDALAPPRSKVFTGVGDFKKIGDEFLRYFVELCGLRRDARVLEVGSGIGRMAIALTKHLESTGSYEGIDIVPDGVRWCQKKITPRYPNFRFVLADIYNKAYNRRGKYQAAEYRFPAEDGSYDFVLLTSVFTHMLPEDMEHYFQEIARVLKRGGKCLITFFLLNDESFRLMDAGRTAIAFSHEFGKYRIANPEKPEDAVAYDEAYVRELFSKQGLQIDEPSRYGWWSGRPDFLSMQDIIIATKA